MFRSDVWKIHENDSPMKTWLKWLKTKKHVNAIFDDPLVRPCSGLGLHLPMVSHFVSPARAHPLDPMEPMTGQGASFGRC